jgi:uncharacterized protein YjiK
MILFLFLTFLLQSANPLARCPVNRAPAEEWTLPGGLAEVSGLAVGPGGLLLAHGDEIGRVLELDPKSGKVPRRITLKGEPKDDFEGIAASGDSIALMTSNGRIYFFRPGKDEERVSYTTIETGLGKYCELEGLAWDTRNKQLLIPCKDGRTPATMGGLIIFRWSLAAGASQPKPIAVSPEAVAQTVGIARIRPTSVEIDPVTGTLVVLSSRPLVLIALQPNGRIVGVSQLRDKDNPRPEGLTLTRDALYIGNEAVGKHATVARYACGASK